MKFLFVFCVVPLFMSAQEPKNYELWAKEKAMNCYNQFAPLLAPTNLPFSEIYSRPFTLDELGINTTENHMGKNIYVYGQFAFSFVGG